MSYEEYVEVVKHITHQYEAGAITAREAFNAIVARCVEVEQTDEDTFPGEVV